MFDVGKPIWKINGFLASINMESYCLRTDQLNVNNYMDVFGTLMNRRNEIASDAKRAFEELKNRQQAFVDYLLSMFI